jgi:drug/metabolite transporter (DMT)-like permease
MHRQPLGRGRRLAFIAAVVILAGCVLPWYRIGGDGGLPPITYHVVDGTGLFALLAALATIALMTLPYAMIDRPVGVDRPILYAILAIVAVIGVALWIPQFLFAPQGFLPDRAPGLWVSAIGVVILARAAYDIALERPRF